MRRALVVRLLLFVPVVLAVPLVVMVMQTYLPGGAASRRPDGWTSAAPDRPPAAARPVFYFRLGVWGEPDTLFRLPAHEQTLAQRLLYTHGHWALTERFLTARRALADDPAARRLSRADRPRQIDRLLGPDAPPAWRGVRGAWLKVRQTTAPWSAWVPRLFWHGTDNQYHNWLRGWGRGQPGTSDTYQASVAVLLGEALPWTVGMSGLAIGLALAVAIPAGVWLAIGVGAGRLRWLRGVPYLLYAVPDFWLATLLVLLFSETLGWLPAFGTGTPNLPAGLRAVDLLAHLVMPLTCWSCGAAAYLTDQVRTSVADALRQDYAVAAGARGLSRARVVWRHALPNALLPVVTLLGQMLPAVVGGAVVLETIFTLPGMGRLAAEAYFTRDYPVVYAVAVLTSAATLAGLLLSDALAVWLDPRLRFSTLPRQDR